MRRSLESMEVFTLLAAVALVASWALSVAALNLPDFCRSEPILLCSSSNYGHVHPWLTWIMILGGVNVCLVMRSAPFASWYTLLYVVVVGVANRILREAMLFVSDVIDATREALGVLFSGHNPYLHAFITTRPPFSPFPYLPGELLFYGIPYGLFHTIDNVDRAAGVATVVVLAALAPVVGIARTALCVALYATFGLAASTAIDGTNDGALALLLIVSVVLLAWSEVAQARSGPRLVSLACFYASALFLAWALLFKAFSWPFFPFIIAYLMGKSHAVARRYSLTVATVCVFVVAPFLFPSPYGFFLNVYHGFVFHEYLYGMNVWTSLQNMGVLVDPGSRFITPLECLVAVGVFLILLHQKVDSLGQALMGGLAVILAALFLAHFSTSSYYTFAASVFIVAIALLAPVRAATLSQ